MIAYYFSQEAFLETVEELKETARNLFTNDGYLSQVIFFFNRMGDRTGLPSEEIADKAQKEAKEAGRELDDNQMKDLFFEAAKQMARHLDAVACVYISEGWTLEGVKPDGYKKVLDETLEKYGSISNSPNRVEIISIVSQYEGTCWVNLWKIIRDDGGVTLRDHFDTKSDISVFKIGESRMRGLHKIIAENAGIKE